MWRKLLLVVLLFGIGYLIWRRMQSTSEALTPASPTSPTSQPPIGQLPTAVNPPTAPTTPPPTGSTGSGPRPVITRIHRGEPPKLTPASATDSSTSSGPRPVVTRIHRGAPPERRTSSTDKPAATHNGTSAPSQSSTSEAAQSETPAAPAAASESATPTPDTGTSDTGSIVAEQSAPASPTATPETMSAATPAEAMVTTLMASTENTTSSEEEMAAATLTEKATAEITPIDINRADREALIALPGIGPVLADRIIAYREEHGPFKSVDDLIAISGIGERNINTFRKLLYVANE
ncbi:MAG: helix-hairpin-helix domain-containing protein [Chloroflexus sp.]